MSQLFGEKILQTIREHALTPAHLGLTGVLATVALMPAQRAEAISTSNVDSGPDGIVSDSPSLNTNTGQAKCQASVTSYNSIFEDIVFVMSIQDKMDGQWSTDNDFPEPEGGSRSGKGTNTIRGTLKTGFNVRKLAKDSGEHPLRIVCNSGLTDENLDIPSALFKVKKHR
jgi:hypothetical protein